ncbi:MAG TPA: hypothetical protein VN520_15610 [Streptomyces sp.]|uniref:hypothetical protein n=1 Tax=Streptomyces sp. TaxID=1931 RepID=UPI002C7E431E|nr:hypothetical protein [Streptomyces sp.]HWU07786.1 hypothetical protein [Streptomyces sp.]
MAWMQPRRMECPVIRRIDVGVQLPQVVHQLCTGQGHFHQAALAGPNATPGLDDLNHGIRERDLFFYDDADLSCAAEDLVTKKCLQACGDLGVQVAPYNQARRPPLAPLSGYPDTSTSLGAHHGSDHHCRAADGAV